MERRLARVSSASIKEKRRAEGWYLSEGKSFGRVVEYTRPNPKMRRGLRDLPGLLDEHKNTKVLEWFRPPERNTLHPL
jgi:hypothetical protein